MTDAFEDGELARCPGPRELEDTFNEQFDKLVAEIKPFIGCKPDECNAREKLRTDGRCESCPAYERA